jgi:nucleoside-diphosphate-sugar epimerase
VEAGGCRIVLAGSMQEPHTEDPAAVPCSPYAASKWACTGYARMCHGLYQLPVIIARPFMVYGPGQWDLSKLLPYVITSLLQNKSPRVSSGSRALDWVFVDDVVTGLLMVADSTAMDARTIDLGTGHLVTISDMLQRVAQLISGAKGIEFGAIADRPLERPHAARISETRRLTGWSPSTSLDVGLARTIAWYRAQLREVGA